MSILNVEFKARSTDIIAAENILLLHDPVYIGEDHQTDTYFDVAAGRMKLREGNIENALIHYERENTAASKSSQVLLYQHQPDKNLKAVLTKALGIKAIVDKKRKIYFIGNVKFHFDTVQNLGTFIEVEAIDKDGSIGKEKLQEQCDFYAAVLHIREEDFMAVSYSDMIMAKK
jgi:adenylate cyclase, class 2